MASPETDSNVQLAITVLAKVIPIVVNLLSLIPGLNIPIGAIRIIENVITIEQAVYAWLKTDPEGQKVWASIQDLVQSLGANAVLGNSGEIILETRDEVQADFDSGIA